MSCSSSFSTSSFNAKVCALVAAVYSVTVMAVADFSSSNVAIMVRNSLASAAAFVAVVCGYKACYLGQRINYFMTDL